MRKPHATITDAVIRLKAANDRLAEHLASGEKRKTIPPASPWAKSVEELYKPQPVKR